MIDSIQDEIAPHLSTSEKELVRELLRALRSVRYGSVNMTIHDGRLVEIQKIEKIRPATFKERD